MVVGKGFGDFHGRETSPRLIPLAWGSCRVERGNSQPALHIRQADGMCVIDPPSLFWAIVDRLFCKCQLGNAAFFWTRQHRTHTGTYLSTYLTYLTYILVCIPLGVSDCTYNERDRRGREGAAPPHQQALDVVSGREGRREGRAHR